MHPTATPPTGRPEAERLLATLHDESFSAKNAKRVTIIKETAERLGQTLHPPTMRQLTEWMRCADIQAIRASIQTHGSEVRQLMSLSLDTNALCSGITRAIDEKKGDEFVALMEEIGISIDEELKTVLTPRTLKNLKWNFTNIPNISAFVMFAKSRNALPKSGIIPDEKKAEVQKQMQDHLFYWLISEVGFDRDESRIGKQILELAQVFGISLELNKTLMKTMQGNHRGHVFRPTYFVMNNNVDIPEATFQALVEMTCRKAYPDDGDFPIWAKDAKTYAQSKGWQINFEEPIMERMLKSLEGGEDIRKLETMDFLRKNETPALNFRPPQKEGQETKEGTTRDRSAWKDRALAEFAKIATSDWIRGHFMYGSPINAIAKCLEFARELGIDMNEEEITLAAHQIRVNEICRKITRPLESDKYAMRKCAKLGLRAMELKAEMPEYTADFIAIMRIRIAEILLSERSNENQSTQNPETEKTPVELEFGQKIGIDFTDRETFVRQTFEAMLQSGRIEKARKMYATLKDMIPGYNAKPMIQTHLQYAITQGNEPLARALLDWLERLG